MYAIEIKNVWKKYKIGQPKKLAEAIPSFFSNNKQKEFWALRNVNLKIRKGERIGIIGPNGSGKSTLLKILAGITYPTRGRFTAKGKVAALLEVGAGFHSDLTGQENIFLSGTILGMNTSEIRRKYEEIVFFSGVKKFLETPVKYYSSGMFVRLAFSVAIHLNWDVLLLDEVLSVGDSDFQQKSLRKMEELFNSERTVLFVSHNLDLVRKICGKSILLKSGMIQKIGKSEKVIEFYQRNPN
jgi:lipopolysaccharide transport system ATP-binding protein